VKVKHLIMHRCYRYTTRYICSTVGVWRIWGTENYPGM